MTRNVTRQGGHFGVAAAVLLLSVVLPTPLPAESPRTRHARAREKVFAVALQPFLFESPAPKSVRRAVLPTAIPVAGYSPAEIRRAEPIDEAAYFLPRYAPRVRPPAGAEEYDAEPNPHFNDEEASTFRLLSAVFVFLASQVRQSFAGKMKGSGDQNWVVAFRGSARQGLGNAS